MARRLILWDVDGTLVSSGPPGRLALETAAGVVAGLQAVPSVPMSGKTDPQIIAEMLAIAGVASENIADMMPLALEEAERALASSEVLLKRDGFVQPGVPELLDRLGDTNGVRQTLVR